MAGTEVTQYAADLRARLAPLGVPTPQLDELVTAADKVRAMLDAPSGTVKAAEWQAAVGHWQSAMDAIASHLSDVLLGTFAQVSALAALIGDASTLARDGVHGDLTLGPVHLGISSSTVVVQPPALADDGSPDPLPVGPLEVSAIAADLASPFGGGSSLPGGGSLVRLPANADFGGSLQLPLGVVRVSAAAVFGVRGGDPTFVAVLGAEFIPPVQLSFGFSLDRVGGIVGVNRRTATDALAAAVRTGTAGDVLFAVRPPASPVALAGDIERLFPSAAGSHLVGPSLRLSWLSAGTAGSLLSLDVAVVVEIPSGKVAVLGVARASIPGLPLLLNLRLDLLGLVDPGVKLVSIDASLVDSHVFGVFSVYGDAAMRLSWGSQGYSVISVGGFYPGFNPEPARLPALRRAGLAADSPLPGLDIRAEGYFALTSNTVQFGGRLDVTFHAGLEAHGFLQVDALVQFRPFYFEANVSAGFDVSAGGFSFGGITLSGTISGPGPLVIRGSLSIDVFLFSLSWDQTFTLGTGPADVLPAPPSLLDVVALEFSHPENVRADSIADPLVVLRPRPGRAGVAAVPPTGTLRIDQRRVPLGIQVDRLDGRPLGGPQGAVVSAPAGADVQDRFAPGSYVTLTQAEALNRPAFDVLTSGRRLSLADPDISTFPKVTDDRKVQQIVIRTDAPAVQVPLLEGDHFELAHLSDLIAAAAAPPATSPGAPLVTALPEEWMTVSPGTVGNHGNATAAHQSARYGGGVAVAAQDAVAPVSLAGV